MSKKLTAIILILAVSFGAVVFLKSTYVVPVIMYHSIDYNDKTTKLSVSPEGFAREMKFLHENHYNVVGLDKIVSYMKKKERVPPKTIAITFDDGFHNNYEYAYPVLKKYNLPATIFVIVNNVNKPGWMTWSEIKEISDSGVITIGSHTRSHLWLPAMGTSSLKQEIIGSKEILERRLGKKVDFFCYPIGAHDERVERFVEEAGYTCAVATNPGRFKPSGDIYAIKRIKISRTSNNLLVFWIETSGWYTWIKEHRDE